MGSPGDNTIARSCAGDAGREVAGFHGSGMWFYADGGVAGVVTHDISAKDIASIFKHGWVARANVNRYRDQQPTACWIFGKSQAVLIWLSCSRDVDVGYGSCIYSINTYFYHMTSLREKKNIHSPAMTTRVHSG